MSKPRNPAVCGIIAWFSSGFGDPWMTSFKEFAGKLDAILLELMPSQQAFTQPA